METPRAQQVGLENVQSRTSEAGVAVQKKDTTQSLEEVSEVAGWIKEVAPPPASLVYEEPHKKTMHVPELQLDVKPSRKKADDVFGYVITDTEWVLEITQSLGRTKFLLTWYDTPQSPLSRLASHASTTEMLLVYLRFNEQKNIDPNV